MEVSNGQSRSGFTLLELILVMGILVAVLVFTIPAVSSLSAANSLTTAAGNVSNLLAACRSEAVNRRAYVRFHIATTWPQDGSQSYRKLAVVQHDDSTNTDTFVSSWTTLPAGIIVSPQSGTFFTAGASQTPKFTFGGQSIDTTYIEFTPTGALNTNPSNNPITLRLANAVIASSGAVTVVHTNDWADLQIDAIVGRIRLIRP